MELCPISFTLLNLWLIPAILAGKHHLKPDISVNCGSLTSTATGNKEWNGDKHQTIKGKSTTSSTTHKLISGIPVIYKTARISHSQFYYTFHLNPGQKIIRLHFYPTSYKGFTSFKDSFTVEAAQFILLKNFSTSLTAQVLGTSTFTKEFYISIVENQPLNLIFTPTTSPSHERTYALVNGIEVVSVNEHVAYFQGLEIGAQVIGKKSLVYVDNNTALELVHRLNVKHDSVSKGGEFDIVHMWDTIPKHKPNDANILTWKKSVHVGFKYLIRIHFSEIGLRIAETDHQMFRVVINKLYVDSSNDLVRDGHQNAKIKYRDYLMAMKGRTEDGCQDISISLHLNNNFIEGDVILKGFEILKVSNPDNSLASPNPLPLPINDSSRLSLNFFSVMGPKDVIGTISTMMIFVMSIVSFKLREISEAENKEEENKPSARAERQCRRFSLDEVQSATRNFSEAFVIGRGGFGKVYKGVINNDQQHVAIKRLHAYSRQGRGEFLTEIETLSELRHINLVSLIGYCNERKEMILVYEYMKNGTLSDHLYKLERKNESSCCLTWKDRLNICIGAGRGIEYLHTGHRVIHRDIKPSNILLDETFIAKVADFGLAKPEDRNKLQSHVSTNVKGTIGYFDPYYISTHKLITKSDTYAFGVVLFEVLCGRPAVDRAAAEEERSLTKWALKKIHNGEVNLILDSSLPEEIPPESLKAFVEVAERCLHDEPNKRPTMAQVVVQLAFALEKNEKGNYPTADKETRVDDAVTPLIDALVGAGTHTDRNIANNESSFQSKSKQKQKTNWLLRLWQLPAIWKISKPFKQELLSQLLSESGIEVRKFDYATIAYATDRFSYSDKIGEYGFSFSNKIGKHTYKGMLPTGQAIAVKKHSSYTKFSRDILILSQIQHRNIIKLLGYCTYKEELMVVHEFMENQSLHTWLSDETKSSLLHWHIRFKIIVGVAKGLIYLHQDSGMRIIHRYIIPSNILLDAQMNPKVCNFVIARTLDDDQSEVETTVAGALGFLDPNCYKSWSVSVMSDVYSFGVLILVTISGKQPHEFYGEYKAFLVEYVWRAWNEGKALLDLVDKSLGGTFSEEEALRCVQVGLLCTQLEPSRRPTMPSALKMLQGEVLPLDLHMKVAEAFCDVSYWKKDDTDTDTHIDAQVVIFDSQL